MFWSATAVVMLVPLQAILGAVAVWLELPGWVVAFHFVVGMISLATAVLVAGYAFRTPRSVAMLAVAMVAVAWRRTGLRFAGVLLLAAVIAQLGFGIGTVLVGGPRRAVRSRRIAATCARRPAAVRRGNCPDLTTIARSRPSDP